MCAARIRLTGAMPEASRTGVKNNASDGRWRDEIVIGMLKAETPRVSKTPPKSISGRLSLPVPKSMPAGKHDHVDLVLASGRSSFEWAYGKTALTGAESTRMSPCAAAEMGDAGLRRHGGRSMRAGRRGPGVARRTPRAPRPRRSRGRCPRE